MPCDNNELSALRITSRTSRVDIVFHTHPCRRRADKVVGDSSPIRCDPDRTGPQRRYFSAGGGRGGRPPAAAGHRSRGRPTATTHPPLLLTAN
ncbi:hypothetical protein EVAR_78283_1 [Eumeta japonica]|uniref:Uncharacterized protein n=1 Tax=Eumeta variegata TaxID=151549 RepID=A0A4C1T392_EUMVA|nr:hypothetical protein EVAR_78283_1 [Eumeta japonica]